MKCLLHLCNDNQGVVCIGNKISYTQLKSEKKIISDKLYIGICG